MAATTTPAYRRLPGRTAWFRLGGSNAPSSSLWQGPDHLLKIERSASRETYKRFFYRDIQSIFAEENTRQRSLAVFNGILLALLLILAAMVSLSSIDGAIVCGVLAAPFALALMINLALGPTCDTVLVTAVGTERLSSLCRVARSVPAIEQIAAEVGKAQGPVELSVMLSRWPTPVSTPPVD